MFLHGNANAGNSFTDRGTVLCANPNLVITYIYFTGSPGKGST